MQVSSNGCRFWKVGKCGIFHGVPFLMLQNISVTSGLNTIMPPNCPYAPDAVRLQEEYPLINNEDLERGTYEDLEIIFKHLPSSLKHPPGNERECTLARILCAASAFLHQIRSGGIAGRLSYYSQDKDDHNGSPSSSASRPFNIDTATPTRVTPSRIPKGSMAKGSMAKDSMDGAAAKALFDQALIEQGPLKKQILEHPARSEAKYTLGLPPIDRAFSSERIH
ncbi:hypothetical protein N7539_008825 [Penicillium diatomitis]|uniref:Uncharacterized protein n=1 Tax=Penicillium diatomitis TaxID=2819901 RepID=A0A9W9WQL7_9EURO|nr:uncharacterized protein N7539_008825 [Penicillium diatomitis]KAJ5471882.1 hypothetical protein N7539_008825 [Penicillium diatomitis]